MIAIDAVELREAVGANIRERRERLGMSAAELSRRIGAATPTVTNVELGRHNTSLWNLVLIAKVLECRVDDLLPEVVIR